MEIRELMTANPDVCVPTDTCAAAGEIMSRRKCGFVPVVENRKSKRLVGVLTDRDLALHLVQSNRPASETHIEACMTIDPKTVAPDTQLEDAAKVMEEIAVHRVPVVQDGGKLVGVLSLNDIAWQAHKEWSKTGTKLAERQMTEILEAIASARVTKNDT